MRQLDLDLRVPLEAILDVNALRGELVQSDSSLVEFLNLSQQLFRN